jgi:hypothetical protein
MPRHGVHIPHGWSAVKCLGEILFGGAAGPGGAGAAPGAEHRPPGSSTYPAKYAAPRRNPRARNGTPAHGAPLSASSPPPPLRLPTAPDSAAAVPSRVLRRNRRRWPLRSCPPPPPNACAATSRRCRRLKRRTPCACSCAAVSCAWSLVERPVPPYTCSTMQTMVSEDILRTATLPTRARRHPSQTTACLRAHEQHADS